MIVGTGHVGASIAFALLNQRTSVHEIILADLDEDDAKGEVMDLNNALAVAPSYLKISSGKLSDAKTCDIVVVTAGALQKDNSQKRTDLLDINAKVVKKIITGIKKSGFKGILLMITNPLDSLSYLAWKWSGLPSRQVIGSGTILDSARLRHRIAEELKVHPKSVHAYQVGEHGDSEVTLWSSADVGGEKLTDLIKKPIRDKISEATRNEVYEIIKNKGATYYGIATCVTQIINSILNDEHRVLSVSSYDDNTETYNGFPAIVGRKGLIRRLDVKMSEHEHIAFQKSANTIQKTIKAML